MKLNLDRLPDTAAKLAELIGLETTLALVLAYGGRAIQPCLGATPESAARQAALAETIGQAAADILGRHYRNTPLRVPRCDHALRAAVRDRIRTEFDLLTRPVLAGGQGLSAIKAVDALAGRPPLRYTERHIWRILSTVDAGRVVDARQSELF